MSKAVQGAALLGADAAMFATLAFAPEAFAGIALLASTFNELAIPLLTAGLSMEAGAIAGALTSNRGMGITTRAAAAYRQIVYGEQRVGGVTVYESTTGSSNDQYNYVIVLAGHEIDSITGLYLDGRQVFWQGSGDGYNVRNGVGFGGVADGNSHEGPDGNQYNFGGTGHSGIYAEARYGDQTDPLGTTTGGSAGPSFPPGTPSLMNSLHANDGNWGPDGKGGAPWLGGCAYIYLKVEYNSTVFPNAPEIRITLRGKNDIWDPRSGARGWTANSALCTADVILDTKFGLGDVEAFQDAGSLAQLVAAANICDEQVLVEALSATTPTYESRYCTHHHYDCATPSGNVIDAFLASMGGRISQPGGEWYLYPAAWLGPSFTFDESALAGPIAFDPYRSQKDQCNRVSGTYTAANFPWNVAGNLYDANGFYDGGTQNNFPFAFQPSDYPPYAADVLHGFAADEYLNTDSGLTGPYSSIVSYNLGDVVSFVVDGTAVMFKSLIAANLGNEPDTHSDPGGSADLWYSYNTYAAGEAAVYLGQLYISLVGSNTGNTPGASPTDWAVAAWVPYSNLLPMQMSFPTVLSVTQAQRLAKIGLMRNRFGWTGDLPMMQRAFAMQCCDVMAFTFPAMGWTGKTLEIMGVKSSISEGGKDTAPRDELSMHVAETDISIYEWDPSLEELTVYDVPATPSQQNRIVAPPTGMSLTSGLATAVVGLDGTVRSRIEVQWATPADALTTLIQIQYQLTPGGVAPGPPDWTGGGIYAVGDMVTYGLDFYVSLVAGNTGNQPDLSPSDWGPAPWITSGFVDVSLNLGYIPDVVAGAEYNVRIRSLRTLSGASSVWLTEANYIVSISLSVIAQGLNSLDPGSLLGEAFAPAAFTGNTTSGSAAIAGVSSTTGMLVGQGISGSGIPAFAVIASIGSGTITLSVAATATASAVALTGAGTSAIVPADGVGAFTAQIGSLLVSVAPSNYPLLEVLQQQLYYVYYIDPTCAGGAVTAIATTNQADFMNKVGYYLIDSVVTPKWISGTGGTGGIYRPSSSADTGTRSTRAAASAYDGNTSTFATVSGNMNGNGSGSTASSNGVCTWSGFSAVTLPASTLNVLMQAVGTSDASIPYTLTVSIGGTVTALLSDSVNYAQAYYTLGIAAGVDLSTISVTATVLGAEDGDYDSISPFNQTASLKIYEIYIQ